MRANLKRKRQVCLFLMVILLFTLVWQAQPAWAQNDTVLTFDPDLVNVPLGNQVQLQLWVLEGVNVNAFDIELEYDPDVLSLASWSYGDFLKQLAQVMLVVEPGHFRLAATQLAQPVVSGSGVLLNFTFNTIALGETTIDLINGQFSDALGNSSIPALEDALVRVINAPTYTPTYTSTPTQTPLPPALPTATSTQAPTSTPTATATPLPSSTAYWTGTATRINIPPIGGNDEPGEWQYPTPMLTSEPLGQEEGGLLETQIYGGSSGGGMDAALALVPGYEQTAQVAHYATLMAQAEAMQAGALATNAQGSLESTLWIVLIAGLVILAVLLVVAVRRRQKL